jgi:hypothetical protein
LRVENALRARRSLFTGNKALGKKLEKAKFVDKLHALIAAGKPLHGFDLRYLTGSSVDSEEARIRDGQEAERLLNQCTASKEAS